MHYSGQISSCKEFLDYLYNDKGYKKSLMLSEFEVETLFLNFGIFKLKGYIREIDRKCEKSIDDLILFYLFDNYFKDELYKITSYIENKIKSFLIEAYYENTKNHFSYLIEKNHKLKGFYIDIPTLNNWLIKEMVSSREHYHHYIYFYLSKYNFLDNKKRYLYKQELINMQEDKYNYPPFKYLIESATFGTVISFILSLKIKNREISKIITKKMGLKNVNVLKSYLLRLKEIRNRVAHNNRLINRTFMSVAGIDNFKTMRKTINNHKSLDVYLFLYFLINGLDYKNLDDFIENEFMRLFEDFKKDTYYNNISYNFLQKLDDTTFSKFKEDILNIVK